MIGPFGESSTGSAEVIGACADAARTPAQAGMTLLEGRRYMAWVAIDDQFADHPKFLAIGDDGLALWVRGLAYCNKHLTDGFIPEAALSRLSESKRPHAVAKKLVEARAPGSAHGLWDVVDGGYRYHDFHEYQRKASDVVRKRSELAEKRSEAGRRGAQNRWQKPWQTDGKPMANGCADDGKPMANAWPPSPSPSPSPSSSQTGLDHMISSVSVSGRVRTHTHAQQSSQQAPSSAPDSDRGVPEGHAEILAMLAAHPALADVATEPMAQHVLGLAIGAGKRREWVRRAISDLARDAGSAAATGKPWSEDYLGAQLGRYVGRAREDRARAEFQATGRGNVASPDQSPVKGPAGALLGKWSATYASSKRGYGIYLPSPDDPAIVERLAMRASDAAEQPGVSHSADDILAHWFRSYLRNDGAKGFYIDKRHALVWLERNLNDFGLPAEKKPKRLLVAEEPAQPTEEALRERDAFLSKAATFGNGGNGVRVERPRHNGSGKDNQ